jgi:hypothetical protein
MRHIAMSGNTIGEVNAAEKHCEPGEVVMSPNAWELCNRDIFKGYEVGSGHFKFFKVEYLTTTTISPIEVHPRNTNWKLDILEDGDEFNRIACRIKRDSKIDFQKKC